MTTATAHVGDTLIATTDDPIVVEGNVYFPEHDIVDGVLLANNAKSLCFWKGVASYYDVAAGGVTLPSAAFTYHHPSPLARRIKGRIAFWNGVDVSATGTRT
ncbi:MAG: DUF427 domain-containing protein [Rhodococcus sp. (in: high G+C Gram-positive bacteria)]|uniref:DUF427 domain-containing protein n=1 Tax=Rhodococcus sp. TaxID=1831 RepID=UPI003BB1C4B5